MRKILLITPLIFLLSGCEFYSFLKNYLTPPTPEEKEQIAKIESAMEKAIENYKAKQAMEIELGDIVKETPSKSETKEEKTIPPKPQKTAPPNFPYADEIKKAFPDLDGEVNKNGGLFLSSPDYKTPVLTVSRTRHPHEFVNPYRLNISYLSQAITIPEKWIVTGIANYQHNPNYEPEFHVTKDDPHKYLQFQQTGPPPSLAPSGNEKLDQEFNGIMKGLQRGSLRSTLNVLFAETRHRMKKIQHTQDCSVFSTEIYGDNLDGAFLTLVEKCQDPNLKKIVLEVVAEKLSTSSINYFVFRAGSQFVVRVKHKGEKNVYFCKDSKMPQRAREGLHADTVQYYEVNTEKLDIHPDTFREPVDCKGGVMMEE